MKQVATKGIVLARTNYGEANRILTVITPDHGKVRLMARGVRKPKSKLAGGIELLSVSDITFIRGRSDIATLTSARLVVHFDHIVKDIDRTMLSYDLIKQLHKTTEDQLESDYFDLLEKALRMLNAEHIYSELIYWWFIAQLMKLGGHTPNLHTDTNGNKLVPDQVYGFDFDAMTFALAPETGHFTTERIKMLRLLFSQNSPQVLQQVRGVETLCDDIAPLLQAMRNTYITV